MMGDKQHTWRLRQAILWSDVGTCPPPSRHEKRFHMRPGSDSGRVNLQEAITTKFDFLLCEYFLFIMKMWGA